MLRFITHNDIYKVVKPSKLCCLLYCDIKILSSQFPFSMNFLVHATQYKMWACIEGYYSSTIKTIQLFIWWLNSNPCIPNFLIYINTRKQQKSTFSLAIEMMWGLDRNLTKEDWGRDSSTIPCEVPNWFLILDFGPWWGWL